MYKLSIITINYNNAEGLDRTIKSVVSQTFLNYEFIIIDGGSTDNSLDILKRYADKITYWVSEKDEGLFYAQNKGLSKAKGDYLQVLNSGDILATNTILSEIFDNENYKEDILYGNMLISDGKGKITEGFMPSGITLKHMIKDTLWHPVSFVRKAFYEKVGPYNTNYKLVADYEWFVRALFIHKAKTEYLNKFIAVFVEDGLTSNPLNTEKIIKEKALAQKSVFTFRMKALKSYYHIKDMAYGIMRRQMLFFLTR